MALPLFSQALPYQSLIKEMPHKLAYKPPQWGHLLNWHSFFPNDSSLCQMDETHLPYSRLFSSLQSWEFPRGLWQSRSSHSTRSATLGRQLFCFCKAKRDHSPLQCSPLLPSIVCLCILTQARNPNFQLLPCLINYQTHLFAFPSSISVYLTAITLYGMPSDTHHET